MIPTAEYNLKHNFFSNMTEKFIFRYISDVPTQASKSNCKAQKTHNIKDSQVSHDFSE